MTISKIEPLKPMLKVKKLLSNFLRLDSSKSILDIEEIIHLSKITNKAFLEQAEELYKKLIENISIPLPETQEDIKHASRILSDNGILVIDSFIRNADLLEVATNAIKTKLPTDSMTDQAGALSYHDLSHKEDVTILIRNGEYDNGMIDIFNIDKSPDKNINDLRKLIDNDTVKNIIEMAYNKKFVSENLNLYLNENVTNTRPFHVDAYRDSIKSFLYLSDVKNLDHGPYCFVLKSHKDIQTQKMNKKVLKPHKAKLNFTDCPFFNINDALPILGKAGTLIISNQQGIHRGFPQKDNNSKRIVLVLRYNQDLKHEKS